MTLDQVVALCGAVVAILLFIAGFVVGAVWQRGRLQNYYSKQLTPKDITRTPSAGDWSHPALANHEDEVHHAKEDDYGRA